MILTTGRLTALSWWGLLVTCGLQEVLGYVCWNRLLSVDRPVGSMDNIFFSRRQDETHAADNPLVANTIQAIRLSPTVPAVSSVLSTFNINRTTPSVVAVRGRKRRNATAKVHVGGDDNKMMTMMTPDAVVAAAALKRIAQLVTTRRITVHNNDPKRRHVAASQIVLLIVETAAAAVDSFGHYVDDDDYARNGLGVNACCDALAALSLLSHYPGVGNGLASARLQSTAQNLWKCLEECGDNDQVATNLTTRRLTACIVAVSLLRIEDTALSSNQGLYAAICQRLAQGDALSRMNMSDFTNILKAMAHQQVPLRSFQQVLLKASAKRLRKKAVRESATRQDLAHALAYIALLVKKSEWQEAGRNEMDISAYTIANEVLQRSNSTLGEPALSAPELGALLSVAQLLELNSSNAVMSELRQRLLSDQGCLIDLSDANLSDLALLAGRAIPFWSPHDGRTLLLQIGARFEDCVTHSHDVKPESVNAILRSVVLFHSRDRVVMHPYIRAARHLFLTQSFLNRCEILELSNFVWFLWRARCDDDSVLDAIAHRFLEPGIASSCTPKLACRILSTFTAIHTSNEESRSEDRTRQESLLLRLFDCLGEHLLSVNMSPLDVGSAVLAYAKAGYVRDMGIFDHLMGLVASHLAEYHVRQLVQCLWACGKMVIWEGDGDGPGAPSSPPPPPYMAHCEQMIHVLAQRSEELTVKDVAQSLWAVGRLQIHDTKLIRPLIRRARHLEPNMNTQEVANIVWALGKIESREFKTIFVLTRRFTSTDGGAIPPSPQEAASILYALGRLDIRDEAVFGYLSRVVAANIEAASAQAVANVLWAHRAVHIAAPQYLMDDWARRKLGLMAAAAAAAATTH